MSYYIDLSKISIEEYKTVLRDSYLLPSWKILENNIEENMDIISSNGIENLEQLKTCLKNKKKTVEFSEKSGLDIEYLTVLRRVVIGYHPKVNKIKDFPNTKPEVITLLAEAGIVDSYNFYNRSITSKDRKILADQVNITLSEIERIAHLSDLSRIKWVNHTFAYLLYETGYSSVDKVAKSDFKDIYAHVKEFNQKNQVFKGNISLHDMELLVELANKLDIDMKV